MGIRDRRSSGEVAGGRALRARARGGKTTVAARSAVSIWLAAGMALSQTYVVDAAGGPGSQFQSIAAAAAAVPSGAVLLVRPGTYGSFTIDAKSLSIFADPGVQILDLSVQITVRNLAPGEAVVLHGMQISGQLASATITLQNNLGPVLLQRCTTSLTLSGASLGVFGCADVRAVDCSFEATQPAVVSAVGSQVEFSRTAITSTSGFVGGVRVSGARVHFADCSLLGAGLTASVPVLQLDAASTAYLAGATTVGAFGTAQTWGIGPVGTVWLDPGVQVTTAVPVAAGVALTVQGLPVVTAPAVAWGAQSTATLRVPAGGIGGLFAGLPVASSVVPPFATPLGLDPTMLVACAGGTGPLLVGGIALPPGPALRGLRFGWQGWSYDPAGGWQAGNTVVLAPW
jgi:hypothetical protein